MSGGIGLVGLYKSTSESHTFSRLIFSGHHGITSSDRVECGSGKVVATRLWPSGAGWVGMGEFKRIEGALGFLILDVLVYSVAHLGDRAGRLVMSAARGRATAQSASFHIPRWISVDVTVSKLNLFAYTRAHRHLFCVPTGLAPPLYIAVPSYEGSPAVPFLCHLSTTHNARRPRQISPQRAPCPQGTSRFLPS